MKITVKNKLAPAYDAVIIPFMDTLELRMDSAAGVLEAAPGLVSESVTEIPEESSMYGSGLREQEWCAVKTSLKEGKLKTACGSVYSMNLYAKDRSVRLVLVQLGDGTCTNREVFLAFAKAFKSCKEAKAAVTAVMLDNAPEITHRPEVVQKICELPLLVSYQFNAYKSVPVENGMMETVLVTLTECVGEGGVSGGSAAGAENAEVSGCTEDDRIAGVSGNPEDGGNAEISGKPVCRKLTEIAAEAQNVAESTLMARDLVNHPSMYMTPEKLAEEAKTLAEEIGIEAEILNKAQAEELGMGSFLAVARGAAAEPKVIVLRYHGGPEGEAPVALVGKGVMFDSGGYSLKSKMATMHDDMGGAAAVIGAIRAIAKQKLPINVVAVVAACENMVSGDAYVPGDILFSMNGKTIEMLNADAEGRLTLVDAITYAIRKEGAGKIIDIATLTGAAKGAVGGRSAAVVVDDEELFEEIQAASEVSCEKIWRLPADKELFDVLKSEVADIKNSNPGNTMGGGTIVAALFIQEFTEGLPWCHVDMAPVNWLPEGNSYCIHGASGYGVSLLYEMVKVMAE